MVSFDFALRRRFHWTELEFDRTALKEMLRTWDIVEVDMVIDKFQALNNTIKEEPYLGPDYRIGHGYAKYQSITTGAGRV